MVLTCVFMGTSDVARAEYRLTIEVQEEVYDSDVLKLPPEGRPDLGKEGLISLDQRTVTIWVGDQRARQDSEGRPSMIALLDNGKLYILKHSSKTYLEFEIPVQVERFAEPEIVEKFRELVQRYEIEVEESQEARRIDQWDTRRVDMRSRPKGSSEHKLELWVADLGFDLDPYWSLLKNRGALTASMKRWAEAMARLDGYPVVYRDVSTHGRVEQVRLQRLISVTKESADDALFAPPADYRKEAYDPSRLLRRPRSH